MSFSQSPRRVGLWEAGPDRTAPRTKRPLRSVRHRSCEVGVRRGSEWRLGNGLVGPNFIEPYNLGTRLAHEAALDVARKNHAADRGQRDVASGDELVRNDVVSLVSRPPAEKFVVFHDCTVRDGSALAALCVTAACY